MNTRTSSCRPLCVPLMVSVVLSACGYKGPLYLPPSVVEPTRAAPATENSNDSTATPGVPNATSTPIPMNKKVVNP
ncbi:MAG: Prokaryotic lipoprotein-attachment site [Burkholderiaceae bacterium]|nr:Prokaryotic lipoprotein-attachment site [Burkholderiaceae bacterium]